MASNRLVRPEGGNRKSGTESGSPSDKENGKNTSGFNAFLKKYPVFSTIAISLIAIVIVYFWQDFTAGREQKRIINAATEKVEQNNTDMLMLFSRPMVWSIRAEMLRGNHENIDLLISDMVREKDFSNIFVANSAGEIIVSTNKRQEGQPAADHIPPGLLASDSTIIAPGDADKMFIMAPVLGYDRRIGSLVIEYIREEFSLDI